MPFENVHNFEALANARKENHMAHVRREAANARMQIGTGAAQRALKRRQRMSFRAKFLHERFGDGDAATLLGNVSQYRG